MTMRTLNRGLRRLAVALPLLSGSVVALAQQEPDLHAILTAQIDAARSTPLPELWRKAASLRDTARDLSADGLDKEVESALDAKDLTDRAALMLIAIRLQGGDPTAVKDKLAERLTSLLSAKDDEISVAAAGLCADSTFRTLESDDRHNLIDRLQSIASDAARAPAVRLEAAYAVSKIGLGDDVRKARSLMNDFLASGDSDLRAQGALTLARSGGEISGKLYDELRKLSVLPDERGQLASSFLEKERVRELGERKLKNLDELNKTSQSPTAPSLPKDEFSQLQSLMTMIRRAHPDGDKVTEQQLLEAAMQGMLQSMDEHSSYLPPKAYEKFEQDLAAGYGGIGAYVGEDRNDGLFTITRPIYSGPAYKKGLMSEDKIVRIDDWPTIGKPTDEIIKRLKGRPGTEVKLYVWRRGMDASKIDRPTEDMAVTVKRQAITIPAEQHQMLPGKVGMVVLQEFSQVASGELRRPLLELVDGGMQALVLDLRNNSGGLLDEAVAVAGLFLPKGSLVVSTESPIRPEEKLYTQDEPIIPPDMPIVVLVNRFTASAAEIVSGALQDHRRATIIGERSFGKGSVQNLIPLAGYTDDEYKDENHNRRWDNWEPITKDWNGNGEFDFAPRVKLTIARYFLPTHRSIHREVDKEGNLLNVGGITPDVAIEAHRLDSWRIEEMLRLRDQNAPRDYVEKNWSEYKDRFSQLADNDRKDTSLYPDFDAWYKSLNTPLSPDDVRQLVRAEVRRRVQDARGQEFPQGDFVEDHQLQAGIRELFTKLGKSTDDVAEYKTTIEPDVKPRLNLAAANKNDVRDALDELNKALKANGRVSEPTLNQLVKLLRESLNN
jgi:carboxyl-terminal processing protease